MEAEKQISMREAWFCTTGLPSDIVIQLDDMTFHLHKFPLISRSRKLHHLISEQESISAKVEKCEHAGDNGGIEDNDDDDNEDTEEEDEEERCSYITLPDFPGGSEAFEVAIKFCYGVKTDLSSSNVVLLRCAGEFLEMTDEYSEDNLISKTEQFLSQSVFKSVKESIKALKSCERMLPMAEDLGVVHRCIESISIRASASDPSLFGWPVNETGVHRKSTGKSVGTSSWFGELVLLSLPFFKRLILSMKSRDLSPEVIENSLLHYAKKHIPGINRKQSSSSSSIPSENEQREILETIVTNLPPLENGSKSQNVTRVLFGLLRTANILKSEACKSALERKIGSQLDHATLDDLLIPSYSYLNETLYDVECVERILRFFLGEDEHNGSRLMLVGKLIDGYLSEIASDANLKPEKFYQLAVALPDHARQFDDGLYRSVDVYLKAHPWLIESDREKICGVMNCQKLTLEACTHAAQNERLPLRSVVQVLFFEQLQLREAIAGSLVSEDTGSIDVPQICNLRSVDMESMRSRVQELERECCSMKEVIEKSIDKSVANGGEDGSRGGVGWKKSLEKKFGCRLKMQVCDSHESTVVETRGKGGNRHRRR
ncbi:BTB/POZ domain-containing protein At5g66560-like [Impatiens glandulifera]|uniref:BTB/POZ domain-containing protein At5g66560-like n=1 Tax=Impatiens glandulifera TaxID=253017 RepID=UPI001FB0AF09|nr:BTB/POZ domain-containing protein At5g66560-like [Impatiens glandulifera]